MSKHQTCVQCHCDFVGPDLNIGQNMCDGCYTQVHFDCTEETQNLQSQLAAAQERIEKMTVNHLSPESRLSGYGVLVKSLEGRRDELRERLAASQKENTEWQEQIADHCIEIAELKSQLATEQEKNRDLKENTDFMISEAIELWFGE